MRGLDFFENILPEGPVLGRMAVLAGVRPVDTYGILKAFGRDCAGAIMLLPDGERPGETGGSWYAPMTRLRDSRLIDEAVTWGIRRRAAAAVVTEMLEQVLTAIPDTPGDERVLAVIWEQATAIRGR